MVRRRILNPEQVVEHGPDVALGVPRLALTDVEDHDASGALGVVGRLNGESDAEIALQMDSTNDRSERAREPVSPLLRATVPDEAAHRRSRSPARFPTSSSTSLRTGRGVTTSNSGTFRDDRRVVRAERVRRSSGHEPPVGERDAQTRAVELLEFALVGSVVALKLVDERNDEVALATALSKIGNSLGEVERGVPWNSWPPARRPLHRDNPLLYPFIERWNARTDDLAAWLLLIVSSRSPRRPSMIGSSSSCTSPPRRAVLRSARMR